MGIAAIRQPRSGSWQRSYRCGRPERFVLSGWLHPDRPSNQSGTPGRSRARAGWRVPLANRRRCSSVSQAPTFNWPTWTAWPSSFQPSRWAGGRLGPRPTCWPPAQPGAMIERFLAVTPVPPTWQAHRRIGRRADQVSPSYSCTQYGPAWSDCRRSGDRCRSRKYEGICLSGLFPLGFRRRRPPQTSWVAGTSHRRTPERCASHHARATPIPNPPSGHRLPSTAGRLRFMKLRLTTTLVLAATLVLSTFSALPVSRPAQAQTATWNLNDYGPTWSGNVVLNDNVVLRWNEQLLETIRKNPPTTGPTVTARALGVVHTAMYDAWAAYDPVAKGTRMGGRCGSRPGAQPGQQEQGDQLRGLQDPGLAVPGRDLPPQGRLRRPDGGARLCHRRQRHPRRRPWSASPPPMPSSTTAATTSPTSSAAPAYSDTTGYTSPNDWNSVADSWRWQRLAP